MSDVNTVVTRGAPADALLDRVDRRFAASAEAAQSFFAADAGRIAEACLAMAKRFEAGGRLLVFGVGAAASDAHHVSVEFVHPVLVGKRALPAIDLTSDVASLSGLGGGSFATVLERLGRPGDIAMGIRAGPQAAVTAGLDRAAELRMLPIELADAAAGPEARGGFAFGVPSDDPLVVQEVQETLYHVLWELVHVFFEPKGGLT